MIRVVVANPLRPESFKAALDAGRKDFYAAAMKLIVDDITRGIQNGIDATGSSFPELEPETIRRKGHSQQLIDKGLLRDPWTYQQLNAWRNNTGTISIKSRSKGGDMPRDKVGSKLQLEGVNSKRGKKFFYFFGISKDAEDLVVILFDKVVQEALLAI